jgi:hypothetical protein
MQPLQVIPSNSYRTMHHYFLKKKKYNSDFALGAIELVASANCCN